MDKPKRLLIKLSGEMLMGDSGFGIHVEAIAKLAEEVVSVHKEGYEIGLVIGSGNIIRGVEGAAQGLDRSSADYMGMLGTVMNAIALQNVLENLGAFTRVMTAINMDAVAEPYIRRRAIRHMEKGRIVIFAAGTGNPFFTTDTAGALKGVDIGADLLIKATRVDGIYDKDPLKYDDAHHYDSISYSDVLSKNLHVMDAAAIALCRDNNLPIIVCSVTEKGNLLKVLNGDIKHTKVAA
jgi:uridylate kinase